MAKDSLAEMREKALETALSGLEKTFGKGSVMILGEATRCNVSVVSTGCLALDVALGVGGIPRGRIIEIFGQESAGKTLVALYCAAEVQKQGGTAAIIDVEHAIDPEWATKIGVNINKLLISQPGTGEEALEIADALVRSGAVDLIIVDSVAALVPRSEIEGEMGQSHMGLQARLMSQALRKLGGSISKGNCTIIFINQLREKIGVYFGNPEITPGGKALKYWASIRMEIRKGEPIKDGTTVIGCKTKGKIVKNKVAPPFRLCEFDVIYGEGISREGCAIDLGVTRGIVVKSGAFFSYNNERLGQGRENAKKYLKEHPEITAEIEDHVRNGTVAVGMPSTDTGDESEQPI